MQAEPLLSAALSRATGTDTRLGEIVGAPAEPERASTPRSAALVRLAEAEDTLRAIGAGEIDAFVVSDGGSGQRVVTLSSADRPYRMLVENMRDGAATLSSSGLILYANRRLAELLSCSRETLVGSPLAMFAAAGVPIELSQIRGPDGLGTTIELDLVDAKGAAVPVRMETSPLVVDGEQLTCLTVTDLTAVQAQEREIARLSQAQTARMADLQEAQTALSKQATHDALTGLPNRALLVDRIDQALSRAKRSGRCTAVLFVDLDRFKRVNDSHGHAAGDTTLRRVADTLVAVLRPTDTVARLGGDEFVVLAADVESQMHAVDISTRLITELCRLPDRFEDGERVAASVGISVSVGGSGTVETLLKEAETAMSQAKSRGGGYAEVFDAALGRQVQQRSIAQDMLQSALDDDRIILYYQPVIDLPTGSVAGFEALARIVQRDGSLVPPAAFIPVAEDSGLVVPLGAQVLEMACREAPRWQPVGLQQRRLTVAVNLSSRQFQGGDLTTVVRRTLEQTGLDPSCLHLELTETALIDLDPEFLAQLGRLGDLGVQIGLDDFGTGYASLIHLRRLPLTFVKIDQSFVQGLGTDHEDERIVSAVVDLAANLGLRSIAEGIETQHQLDRLRELGCDHAQGYLFSRPLPPDDIPTAIRRAAW
jgi:diguanylate cyclase (GGDEF)-like protein/PAS domain S-box-containing protein